MYAIVDLETTGGNAGSGRIIEVAVYLYDGHRIEPGLCTLVDPQTPIPPFITQLTGIRNDMVAGAPRFEDIADQIEAITEQRVLVAHNAGFDYGFLRSEMAFMGRSFIRKHLCTLEMARKWVPDAPSHSLGKLCDYLGIRLKDRHRAHGDAEATAQLLKQLLSVHREDAARAFIKHERSDALPSHLPLQSLQKLPHLPGVYYFTNKEGRTVYIGHGPNLRVSAWTKLQEAPRKRRNGKKLLQSVHDIYYVETGSESLAQLHAYLERIRMQPRYNTRAYRRKDDIQIPVVVDRDVEQVRDVLVFDGWTQARRQLQRWSHKHGFCLPGMRPLRITCPQCRQAACRWDASGRPRPELWLSQQQYETLAREWRFSGNQLLMELRGRDAEERGLILIRDGALAAYGWLPMDRSFFHPDELLQELIPCHDSFETRQVVHQCIKRKGYLSLKPLEHYLASATDEPAISRNL